MFRRAKRGFVLGAVLAASTLLVTACGGSSDSGTPQNGGTAVLADDAGAAANWIFPMVDTAHNNTPTVQQFEYLMYRPLYIQGNGDQASINFDASLAGPPKYTDNNTKAVVDLKPYKWSNGETVSPDNVLFWMNMLRAEKANYAQYVPGEFPDNVKKVEATGPSQVTFTFDSGYAPEWMTSNQLQFVIPMPSAWDKTSDSAAAGSGGCSKDQSKCDAVYKYLYAKSKDLTTYATDPVWQIVDGPWQLKQFSPDGSLTMVPNKTYSGPVKPKLDAFKEVPTTSNAALYNELRAGNVVNVGAADRSSLPQRDVHDASLVPEDNNPLKANYNLTPEYVWGWALGTLNYNNPTFGKTFQQLYVRQAIQSVIDQKTDSQVAYRGYATPTLGSIPTQPKTKYIPPTEQGDGVYPFNVDKAKQLLTGHGWTIQNGVATCTAPGTAPTQCGEGIPAGQKLNPTLEYESGVKPMDEAAQQFKSDAAKVGIQITLQQKPFNTVVSETTTCSAQPSTCGWEMAEFGYQTFQPVPTGDQMFLPGSAQNYSSVNDPKLTELVKNSLHDSSPKAFSDYADYVAQNLPGQFNVADSYKVYAYSKNLHGYAPYNPSAQIYPETWYFTK